MRFTTIINILVTSSLIILGSILGGNLNNFLYVFWICALIFYAVIIQVSINKIQDKDSELNIERAKMSAFLIRKDTNNQHSAIQCSFYPKNNGGKILKNRRVSVDIYTNSTVNLASHPEVKLTLDKECSIYINNQPLNSVLYAGRYDYYLRNSLLNSLEDRYFKYSFEIEFHNIGEHIFKIETSNGEYINEVSNSINVVSG